jgi:hypothetical protein
VQLPTSGPFSVAATVHPERDTAVVWLVLLIATALQSPVVVSANCTVALVARVNVPVLGVPCGAPGACTDDGNAMMKPLLFVVVVHAHPGPGSPSG